MTDMEERKDKKGARREEVSPLKAALLRMADLCAQSEQCAFDITKKLRLKGFTEEEASKVVSVLEKRRFIDAARFARAFASDKLRFAGWGRVKIRAGLAARHIPEEHISEALQALDPDEYGRILLQRAAAKARRLDLDDYNERMKLMRHLVSRGFTPGECSEALRQLRRLKNEE